MNLTNALRKEHNRAQRDRIVHYIGENSERFAELVHVFLQGPYRLTQRASWPLSTCIEKHPALIKPHLKKIVMQMEKPGQHDAVKRNTLRLLQFVSIPPNLQGKVVDISFELLSDRKAPVAARAFAISVLTRLARQQPDLKNELIPLIEEQMPYEKPAFISRARRAIKELKHIH